MPQLSADLNREAIDFLLRVRDAHESPQSPMPISGQLGPLGDGYAVESSMTAAEAEAYHSWQAKLFAQTEADMISVMTLNYVEEAVGVARAVAAAGPPDLASASARAQSRTRPVSKDERSSLSTRSR